MKQVNIDQKLCRQCRGRCCQGHPGVWSDPSRFFAIFNAGEIPSAQQFKELLENRQLTLRDLGGVLIPAPLENETGCSLQRSDGCALSAAVRPCQCLALIPDIETLLDDQIHCRLQPEYGSGSARQNWRPLQHLLQSSKALSCQ